MKMLLDKAILSIAYVSGISALHLLYSHGHVGQSWSKIFFLCRVVLWFY